MKKLAALCLLFLFISMDMSDNLPIVFAQSAPELLQQVNQFRSANGLSPFQASGALNAAAQNQANFMATNTIFSSHIGEGGSTPQSRAASFGYGGYVTENIVGGSSMSVSQGLIWWQNSPVHYRTLVSTRHSQAGTGFATNGSANFYVLVVGTPSNQPPSSAPPDDSPAPLFITPLDKAEPRADGSIVHVVAEGQALWSLAAHYEISLADIFLFNGLTEDRFVNPGDEIIIRLADGQLPPPTAMPPTSHVVREGQSLWSIAALYNVKFGDLLWYNGWSEDVILYPGDEVVVRLADGQLPPPTATPVFQHTIVAGQTLWDIALRYGLSLDELLALNENITAVSILQLGDTLLVRQPDPTAVPTVSAIETAVSTVEVRETAVLADSAQITLTPPPATVPHLTITPTAIAKLNSVESATETRGAGIWAIIAGLLIVGGIGIRKVATE